MKKAPKWLKLCPAAEAIFSSVYEQIINKQVMIKHPQQPVMDKKHWETICYNIAIITASAYEGRDTMIDGKSLKGGSK